MTSDDVLVRRAIEGDAEAFGDLYERYLMAIYRHIFFKIGDELQAEDLTEMVFLKVWEALPRFDIGRISFRSWLYVVAKNTVVDHYRTRKAHLPLEQAEPLPDTQASVEQQVMSAERLRELQGAISQLAPDHREILVLRFVDGLSHEESAEIMQRSVGAVRVLQHRALKALHSLLEHDRNQE